MLDGEQTAPATPEVAPETSAPAEGSQQESVAA